MADTSTTSASFIVRQTKREYQEMRKKLAETECKLNQLAKIEAKSQPITAYRSQQNSKSQAPRHQPSLGDDAGDNCLTNLPFNRPLTSIDNGSVGSEIGSVPGSYTGFVSHGLPASTPDIPGAHCRDGRLAENDAEVGGADGCKRAVAHSGDSYSLKLLAQNHRLLMEVEHLVCELQTSRLREEDLKARLKESQLHIEELQTIHARQKLLPRTQGKAVRLAEKHVSVNQPSGGAIQHEDVVMRVQELDYVLKQERMARSSVESQREEALKNLWDMQTSLENFQHRSHERIKELEESEDYLKDSLAHANAERDDLLAAVERLQTAVGTYKAETEHLQAVSAVEQETKYDMETLNNDIRRQLAKMTSKCQKLQQDRKLTDALQKEKFELRSQLQDKCDILEQIEDLADKFSTQRSCQHESSMVGQVARYPHTSTTGPPMCCRDAWAIAQASSKEVQRDTEGAALEDIGGNMNTNNNGSCFHQLLSDLRGMLYEMDKEIRALRCRLASQEKDRADMVGVRGELRELMQKALKGESRSAEMEEAIEQLESEKSALSQRLSQVLMESESLSCQLLMVEARLSQRNTQIIDLQEDVNKRCEAVARLEKELWHKSTRVSQLESDLKNAEDEVQESAAYVRQSQQSVTILEDELRQVRQKCTFQQQEMERCNVAEQHTKATHQSKCQHYEQKIEVMHSDAEERSSASRQLQVKLHHVEQQAMQKEKQLQELELSLLQDNEDLAEIKQRMEGHVMELESKMVVKVKQMEQLEAALLLCRSEIADHLASMDHTKHLFDMQLCKSDQALSVMDERMKSLHAECMQQKETIEHLEKDAEIKEMQLQKSNLLNKKLQHTCFTLEGNVEDAENRLATEKSDRLMTTGQLDKRLAAQSTELDRAVGSVAHLQQTIQELEKQNKETECERLSLQQDLQNEKMTKIRAESRISELEKNMRDVRVEMEQKIETVGDLENTLASKELDLDQQRSLVEQLDVSILKTQREVKHLTEQRDSLEALVQHVQFDVKAKEQILTDTRDLLRKCQMELSETSSEASELRSLLNERQKDLDERVKKVQHLELTMKETHGEMDDRMRRLDNTLHNYEAEVKERTGQIADLDDRLRQSKADLTETSLQLHHYQQLCHQQQLEFLSASDKSQQLESVISRQTERLEEQRQENVEMSQELKLSRDQLQIQHSEFLSTRHDLAAALRNNEKHLRQCDDLEARLHTKEQDSARLSEELGACQARATQAEARLAAERKQMQRTMEEMSQKHAAEMDTLQKSRDEVSGLHDQAVEKVRAQEGKVLDNEQLYEQRLDSARSELEALHNELYSRKEMIRSANEAMFVKDSEIAHLKAQVSRWERQVKLGQHGQALSTSYDAAQEVDAILHTNSGHQRENLSGSQQRQSLYEQPTITTTTGSNQQPYFLSSGPLSTSSYQDVSSSANLNISHNACQLPMKDSWSDDDVDTRSQGNQIRFSSDHLIFLFEKLGDPSQGLSNIHSNGAAVTVGNKAEEDGVDYGEENSDGIVVSNEPQRTVVFCSEDVMRDVGVADIQATKDSIAVTATHSITVNCFSGCQQSLFNSDQSAKYVSNAVPRDQTEPYKSGRSGPTATRPAYVKTGKIPASTGVMRGRSVNGGPATWPKCINAIRQRRPPRQTDKCGCMVPLVMVNSKRLKKKGVSTGKTVSHVDNADNSDLLYQHHHLVDPETLVGMCKDERDMSQGEVKKLQLQIAANTKRQEEIEQQIQRLECTDDGNQDTSHYVMNGVQ